MQLKTLTLASAAAMTAFAFPQTTPIAEGSKFGVILIRPSTEVQNAGVQAAMRNLFVNLPEQNACCDADTNYATFYIKDQELRLYASDPATTQTIFVDRSGMGMGKIGYITGDEPLGRNWETKGWALNDKNELAFKGTGLQACPKSIDGAWSLWLQGVSKPGWNENCTGVIAQAVAAGYPVGCVYSQ